MFIYFSVTVKQISEPLNQKIAMKKTFLYLRTFVLTAFLVTAFSCSDDDDGGGNGTNGQTLLDIVTSNPELSSLAAALNRSGLLDTFEGDGPFTVFAPTNAAFEAFLTANDFESLNDVPVDVLTDVLLNHVVDGDNRSTGLSTGYVPSFSTAGVSGRNLSLFINTDGGVTVNGVAEVIQADVVASNGVAHVVNRVIGLPTIVDHALANPDFDTLVDALPEDFVEKLSGEGPFTLFAPDNEAFGAFDNPNENAIEDILSNHVLDGQAAFSGNLVSGYVETFAKNADGDGINAYINTNGGVSINGVSDVTTADVVGTNGVIHAVDGVIDVPTVVTLAAANPAFSSLVVALTDATPNTDFVDILSGEGPFTVFAPTNAAFDDVLVFLGVDEITDIDEDTLASVLTYHVSDAGNIRSSDLVDGDNVVPTLEGDNITVILPPTDNGVNIADIRDASAREGGIIAVDVQAGNGVIHQIDLVLLPDFDN